MFKVSDVARLIGAETYLPPGVDESVLATTVHKVAAIATAESEAITFLASQDFAPYLATTGAAAVILAERQPACRKPQLIHANPYYAYAKTAQLFYQPEKHAPGVSPLATVAADANVDPTATIMPFVYVGPEAKIGARCVLYPGVFIGRGASVGDDTELRAHVVVEHHVTVGAGVLIHAGTVLGADGFGFAPGPKGLEKIPQTGSVVIGDRVEIGALCTLDRGALEDTVVGAGTKLDSHVHVGHGATIGQHSVLCAFVGIAGSADIGSGVMLGGHAAVSNKIKLADGVQVGAMAGVTKNLMEKGTYMGFPAGPAGEWRRQVAGARRLPDLEKRVRELEKRLAALEPPA